MMTEENRTQAPEVLKPEGNIIAAASRELREKMQRLIENGARELVIDMSSVELIDSTGIGVLVGIQNTLKTKEGHLKLAKVNSDICKMLKMMRLDRHIEIID